MPEDERITGWGNSILMCMESLLQKDSDWETREKETEKWKTPDHLLNEGWVFSKYRFDSGSSKNNGSILVYGSVPVRFDSMSSSSSHTKALTHKLISTYHVDPCLISHSIIFGFACFTLCKQHKWNTERMTIQIIHKKPMCSWSTCILSILCTASTVLSYTGILIDLSPSKVVQVQPPHPLCTHVNEGTSKILQSLIACQSVCLKCRSHTCGHCMWIILCRSLHCACMGARFCAEVPVNAGYVIFIVRLSEKV